MAGVADLLLEAGAHCAVVLRGTRPVGSIDARHAIRLIAEGGDPEGVTAGSIMDEPAPTVAPDRPASEGVLILATGESSHLVVLEGEDVIGILTDRDVLAAQATFPAAESPTDSAAVAAADGAGDDRYSTQSVCEACGALAGNLANVNGQLLCADCREM
jgi:signal-transduction protein with cAMP-binding, CBS, and nucleotidyltransferase domain